MVTCNTFVKTLTDQRGIINTEAWLVFFDVQAFQQGAPTLSTDVDTCQDGT